MTPFQLLLLAHLVLDYPLQGTFLAIEKKNYVFLLAVHCGMWALGISAVLDHLHLYEPWMLWWLFLGHAAMDWAKCHYLAGWLCGCDGDFLCRAVGRTSDRGEKRWATDPLGLPLVIDQAFHLFQIWICLHMN